MTPTIGFQRLERAALTLVTAPLDGRAIGLDAIPDLAFATAMAGPGMAIDPLRHPMTALAPIDGVVMSLWPHAFVVVDDAGHGVLVHLGIDTVRLPGAGFEPLVGNGSVPGADNRSCGGTP